MIKIQDVRTLTKEKEALEFNLRDSQVKYRRNADQLIDAERAVKSTTMKFVETEKALQLAKVAKERAEQNLENLKNEEERIKTDMEKFKSDINEKERAIKQSEMDSKKTV